MSNDTKLYDAIENNSSIKDKSWFNEKLQFAKEIYKVYDVDYNFDNILDVIKNIKIENGSNNDIIHYDLNSNTLVLGKSIESIEYNLCKSFLQITSQKGLSRKTSDGKEHWNVLNDIIIDRLILNTTGLKIEQESDDLYTLTNDDEKRASQDELLYKIKEIVPVSVLIESFANAKGEELYNNYFKNHDNESINLQTM
ncbi:MAG: hypothetical protein IJ105_01460 [Bacilli bacterium]|nr:hypothetical protein [Bacilli bacterium]